jgi:hypothetical protein
MYEGRKVQERTKNIPNRGEVKKRQPKPVKRKYRA